MKLYGFWRSLATYRVRVALGLKGVAAQEISVDILKGKQFSEEYKALNPQSVVPALVLEDGAPPLFQSLAILEYLEETQPQPALLPQDARGRARVRGLALIAATSYFNCDTSKVPTTLRIYGECMKLPAFERAHPSQQPEAPK